MRLQNGTFQWNKWASPEAEMFLKVYLFNVTNPDEVENGGIPVFQELGPFTYQ
jgi:lysosome membrane protein 2